MSATKNNKIMLLLLCIKHMMSIPRGYPFKWQLTPKALSILYYVLCSKQRKN